MYVVYSEKRMWQLCYVAANERWINPSRFRYAFFVIIIIGKSNWGSNILVYLFSLLAPSDLLESVLVLVILLSRQYSIHTEAPRYILTFLILITIKSFSLQSFNGKAITLRYLFSIRIGRLNVNFFGLQTYSLK